MTRFPAGGKAVGEGMFVCGEYHDTASIQGARFTGEQTAAAVLRRLDAPV